MFQGFWKPVVEIIGARLITMHKQRNLRYEIEAIQGGDCQRGGLASHKACGRGILTPAGSKRMSSATTDKQQHLQRCYAWFHHVVSSAVLHVVVRFEGLIDLAGFEGRIRGC